MALSIVPDPNKDTTLSLMICHKHTHIITRITRRQYSATMLQETEGEKGIGPNVQQDRLGSRLCLSPKHFCYPSFVLSFCMDVTNATIHYHVRRTEEKRLLNTPPLPHFYRYFSSFPTYTCTSTSLLQQTSSIKRLETHNNIVVDPNHHPTSPGQGRLSQKRNAKVEITAEMQLYDANCIAQQNFDFIVVQD